MKHNSAFVVSARRLAIFGAAIGLTAGLLGGTDDADTAPTAAGDAVAAHASATRGLIPWKSGPFATVGQTADELAKAIHAFAAADQHHVVAQFKRPLLDSERGALEAAGLMLQAYVGDNAYFAAVTPDQADGDAIVAFDLLFAVLPVRTEWKLHPDYLAGVLHPWAIINSALPGDESGDAPPAPEDPVVAAYVVFHPDVALDGEAHQATWRHGGSVVDVLKSINGLVVELPWSSVAAMAAEDAVQWIEPPLPPFRELNNSNRGRVGADIASAPPYGLDGTGVTVMVYDGGPILTTHPDLTPRVNGLDPEATNSNHATHVAGTIGGTGSASAGLYRGMAPGVTILSYEFENADGSPLAQGFLYTNPGDLELNYTEAVNTHGADVTNNSIGTNTSTNGYPCEWQGDYGVTDTLIDAIVRGSLGAPYRTIWANGNERQSTRCQNMPAGVGAYHTTAPPACAKNHLTVGAINSNDDSMTTFSSWGPADDGRLKPDIVAPGCQSNDDNAVTSCSTAAALYDDLCGTSMACPTATGVAALMLQDYRLQYPGEPDFRNSTLRVLLAHTAVDLGNPGPDYQFGFGSIRAPAALDLIRSGNFAEGSLSQDESVAFLAIANAGDPELKVTLAWDDVPGTANVSPALVNDLELRVFAPGGARHYSWTLAGLANPVANAVQTSDNQVDNLEQVYIASPAPGAYRVEIVGRSVPQGPQPFSIAVSPTLVECTAAGVISLDRPKFTCNGTATIRVSDCDLNTDDLVVDTVAVSVASTSEAAGEALILTETSAESANFAGTLPLSTTDAAGTLLVANGDTLTATYIDADNGAGGTNILVTSTAVVDCVPPLASDVQVSNLGPRQATITFVTTELASAVVRFGTACVTLDRSASRPGYYSAHSVTLTGLTDDTTYHFALDLTDSAGNTVTNDNGGACYSFATPRVPDFYTEQFSATLGAPDLVGKTLAFTPDASVDFYSACTAPAAVLPTDPAGGTTIPLTNTNALQVALGAPGVQLYGVTYQSIFVSSGGYITFAATDVDSSETFADHFDTPRISGLFDDLNPATSGQVSWKATADRIAVTYNIVAGAAGETPNTFQIEMFFDGRIQITWLAIGSNDGIIGLSAGNGVDPDFAASDLSAYGPCGPRPPSAASTSRTVATGRDAAITLIAGDDGLPVPPGALTYRIVQLPQGELRDAGNGHVISSGDLPYTVANGENEVIYRSANGFVGADAFGFAVSDGGTPPEGGDSLTAIVSITVEPVLALPFIETFPTTTFDAGRWAAISNATIDALGTNPPSAPNSARFNGNPSGADSAQTFLVDLSGSSLVQLSYSWECRGGGETPDANDDLFVEFLRSDGSWQILRQYLGATTPDMTTFQLETIVLPEEALHSSFRLRIRNTGTVGAFDDWFVDDIRIVSLEQPTANAGAFELPANRTGSLNLEASDPNHDPLTYIILSLPANGELLDPGNSAAVIATVPYTLAGGGDIVRFRPDLGFIGADGFSFRVSDGANQSDPAAISLTIGGRVLVHSFALTTNPGWATEGLWAYGQPTGGGTQNHDPLSGFTGPNVYGYNLAGNYENGLATVRYLTTTAINCSPLSLTQLRFRRWLGIESASFDHANIQASNNGTSWATVWNHTGTSAIAETAWSYQTYDIATIADGQDSVSVRWGMGPTDAGTNFPGWNIDDVEIWGVLPPRLPGDANCDGAINFFDIDPFVVAAVDPAAYPAAYPDCDLLSADVNRDGAVNFFDIDPFIALLFP